MDTVEKLTALRQQMAAVGADYYLIPSQDAHQSEYVAEYWRARVYFSGFTGSAGTLLVGKEEAFLWVDGRYHIQAEQQTAGSGITVFKMGLPGVPNLDDWMKEHIQAGEHVAYDGRMISMQMGERLQKLLPGVTFLCQEDLAGRVWTDRPGLPTDPVFALSLSYTGESRKEKLARVREHMKEKNAQYFMLASLDDIAWLTNLRGNDIDHTPVFYSYMLVSRENAWLFAPVEKFSEGIRQSLEADGIQLKEYAALPGFLGEQKAGKVLLNADRINMLLGASIPAEWQIESEMDITTVYKTCKNETECRNIRKAHVKDGVAMVKFLKWIKEAVQDREHPIDECDAADFLDARRKEQDGCLDLSFGTIAGYNANGASAHYSAKRGSCAKLKPEGMIVVDSGGQYMEGTTDITRTIVLGPITEKMKKAYTLVLKGHLALGHARFMEGTTGHYLDILAREPLWKEGMDFRHGTGHGVGYVLSVHEGPQNIGTRPIPVALKPGMLTSNEPGYYAENEFGVRIENLILTKEWKKTVDGAFLEFETVTLCPYDWEAIDESLLTDEEKQWIAEYHKRVYDTLSPYLNEEEKVWLKKETRQ